MANPALKKMIRHEGLEVRYGYAQNPEKPKEQKEEEKAAKPYQPAVDMSGQSPEEMKKFLTVPTENQPQARGIAGDKLAEPMPKFINTPSEVIYSNQNGSFIVLGRDRSGSRTSGYGGRGDTKCASIDIVVGRLGSEAAAANSEGEELHCDPNFKKDAARIYISQKTDVDRNFSLADGNVGDSQTKSAVAIKADGVRIIAREGIKLVTGTDKKNSQGGPVRVNSGIDLIAGNDDTDMQPIAKATNTAEAIERLAHHVDKLSGIMDAFLHTQMEYNAYISSHWHTSPFFAIPTLPSETLMPKGVECAMNQLSKVKRGIVSLKANLAAFKITYLKPFGKKYVGSRNNNTN